MRFNSNRTSRPEHLASKSVNTVWKNKKSRELCGGHRQSPGTFFTSVILLSGSCICKPLPDLYNNIVFCYVKHGFSHTGKGDSIRFKRRIQQRGHRLLPIIHEKLQRIFIK